MNKFNSSENALGIHIPLNDAINFDTFLHRFDSAVIDGLSSIVDKELIIKTLWETYDEHLFER